MKHSRTHVFVHVKILLILYMHEATTSLESLRRARFGSLFASPLRYTHSKNHRHGEKTWECKPPTLPAPPRSRPQKTRKPSVDPSIHPSCPQQPVWSNTDKLDGGKVWKKKCAGNPMTFENIYNSNHTTDVFAVESARTKAADEAWTALSSSA